MPEPAKLGGNKTVAWGLLCLSSCLSLRGRRAAVTHCGSSLTCHSWQRTESSNLSKSKQLPILVQFLAQPIPNNSVARINLDPHVRNLPIHKSDSYVLVAVDTLPA